MTRQQFTWAVVAMIALAIVLGFLTAPWGIVTP